MTLRICAVGFSYGSVTALDSVSFELGPGVTELLGVRLDLTTPWDSPGLL